MKIVINKCYGGYGLSPCAIARLAELKGRSCFFFVKPTHDPIRGRFESATIERASDPHTFIWWAFDIPNPNDVLMDEENWHQMTPEQKRASSDLYQKHELNSRWDERADPDLVRVVEELGDVANGHHARLRVVEIPDGVEYEIDEYDGIEHVAEAHRTWA